MKLKTYGITNLLDWKAQISAGKAKVIVHFTGGAITAYGVTPAEYSTANPFFQHVIEGSDYYKSGRITLLRETEIEDDAATKARKERKALAEHQKDSKTVPSVEKEGDNKTDGAEDAGDNDETVKPVETEHSDCDSEDEGEKQPTPEADSEEDAPAQSDSTVTNEGKTIVNATCKEDVIEYLKNNFNYTATSLRTKEKLAQAVAEHNLEIVGFEL